MPSYETRVAENEARFRAVNQRLEAAELADGRARDRLALVCECGREDCTTRIELSLEEYRFTRSDGDTFVLAPGHERLEVEEVIRREAGFVVVRKFGVAAEVADELDPDA